MEAAVVKWRGVTFLDLKPSSRLANVILNGLPKEWYTHRPCLHFKKLDPGGLCRIDIGVFGYFTRKEMLTLRNMGLATVNELVEKLCDYDVYLLEPHAARPKLDALPIKHCETCQCQEGLKK